MRALPLSIAALAVSIAVGCFVILWAYGWGASRAITAAKAPENTTDTTPQRQHDQHHDDTATNRSAPATSARRDAPVIEPNAAPLQFPTAALVEGSSPPSDQMATAPSLPTNASVRRIATNGSPTRSPASFVAIGDRLRIEYSMHSHSTGALIDRSPDGGVVVAAGLNREEILTRRVEVETAIPDVLAQALVHEHVGETLQVTFPIMMPDLPARFDPEDAYILTVDILEKL